MPKMKMPDELDAEVDQILFTVEKIKGEAVATHTRFLGNVTALIQIMATTMEVTKGWDKEDIKDAITSILTSLATAHRIALNLSEEEGNEALNAAKTLESLVRDYSKREE